MQVPLRQRKESDRCMDRWSGSKRVFKKILYPVDSRDSSTLLKIIKRHVEPGSTVYTDGWAGYKDLNQHGYNHFSVIHKDGYKIFYKNTTTDATVVVHTNTIEGSWQSSKDHFKMKHGVELSTFESHLAEVVWRNHHRGSPGDVYDYFFSLMSYIYMKPEAPRLTAPRPLFDTWRGNLAEGETVKVHQMFDDAPVKPTSPAQILSASTHDHDYTTSDPVPNDVSDRPEAEAEPEESPQQEEEVAGPSTSRAPERGYGNYYHPTNWVPITTSKEIRMEHNDSSSSEDEAVHRPRPSKFRQRRKRTKKAKCCKNLHELYPLSSDSDFV